MENDESIMEQFEIILDKAKSEKNAKSNVVDYYLCLVEDLNKEINLQEIIDLAENYGYDFTDIEELIKKEI